MTPTQIDRWKVIQNKVGAKPDGDPCGDDTLTHLEGALGITQPSNPGTPNPLAQRLVELAKKEVGVREVQSNRGSRVEQYQAADSLPGGGYAWCAAFICWLVRAAIEGVTVAFDRPTTASAWGFEDWARSQSGKGVTLLKPASSTLVRPGDIVVFGGPAAPSLSHIGLAVEGEDDGLVVTIEGNTNEAGSREGDGVYKKVRRKGLIRSVIRFS